MASKPKVIVFSVIPSLGKVVKQLLPQADIKIINHEVSSQDGGKISAEETAKARDAEILLADHSIFVQMSDSLPLLRWFQGTWAGVEGINEHFKGKVAPAYKMCRMSSEGFSQAMAEFVVGKMIAHERCWRLTDHNQAAGRWERNEQIASYRTLRGLKVALLGVGEIGQEVGRVLRALRCFVTGVSRRPRDQATLQHCIDHHCSGPDGVLEAVSTSDYIVSVLPCTPHTTGLLSAEVLAHFKPGSVLINIGRSNVVAMEDLLVALGPNGRLAAAVLDVFDEEPLPHDSPLWTHPKVVVSPHCAGTSMANDVAETFVDNYHRYIAGQELKHQIDLNQGY